MEIIEKYGTIEWDLSLGKYLKGRKTLVELYAKERQQSLIPVQVAENEEIFITPGEHSQLIKLIVEEFGARFIPGGNLKYAGDTGAKMGCFNESLLKSLGVEVNIYGKMPDVIMY